MREAMEMEDRLSDQLKAGNKEYIEILRKRGFADISGRKFGRLMALYPTEERDKKGSVMWHCECDCGNTKLVSHDGLVYGNYRSCGCLKKELQETVRSRLTFVNGTCIELLKYRKSRSDNTSGFRGVHKRKNGKYKVTIGLQGKRHYLGVYETFEEAVGVRLKAEKELHEGFVTAYEEWKKSAEEDPEWGEENPFRFKPR